MFYAMQPLSTMTRANLATFLNVSGRIASSFQQLTELNVQTVRTMIEESATLLRAGEQSSAGDVLGWHSVMLAQLPEKAASYQKHWMSIVTSTEADIISATRNQYERTSTSMKDAIDATANDVQSASGEGARIVTDMTATMADSAQESAGAILDASGHAAEAATDAVTSAPSATTKPRVSSKR